MQISEREKKGREGKKRIVREGIEAKNSLHAVFAVRMRQLLQLWSWARRRWPFAQAVCNESRLTQNLHPLIKAYLSRYTDQATGYTARDSNPCKIVFSKTSIPAVGPTQWVPGFLCGGQNAQGMRLTTHLHQVPRLRINGVIILLPHMP